MKISESLNELTPDQKSAIKHGAKQAATNWDRAYYFEAAYKLSLTLVTLLIIPAIIISTASSVIDPFLFNPISGILYTMFGVVSGLAIVFHTRKEQSRRMILAASPEYSVCFSKRDLYRSIFIGGLLGIASAAVLYGFGIWLTLHPRGV